MGLLSQIAPFSLTRNASDPSKKQPTLAIDFGKSGGLVFNRDGRLHCIDMPRERRDILTVIREAGATVAFGEYVASRPGQGVVSVATFMRDAGFIDGCLATLDIHFTAIHPAKWTGWYDVGKTKDFASKDKWKKHLQKYAQALFPECEITQDCADAVLIWNYATQLLKPPTFK